MSLTLTDAVPANRTYTATQSDPDLTIWKDLATNTYPSGAGVASLSCKENANGTFRVTGKLVLPAMDSVDATLKSFETIGSFEMVFPNRASLQRRKDQKAMLSDFLLDAVVTAAVENFTHPTG
jgi:hypothetical protein